MQYNTVLVVKAYILNTELKENNHQERVIVQKDFLGTRRFLLVVVLSWFASSTLLWVDLVL